VGKIQVREEQEGVREFDNPRSRAGQEARFVSGGKDEDFKGSKGAVGKASASEETEMTKTIEQWLPFTFEHGEFTPLSKPFKTKKLAEKARLKYPESQRKSVGLGVIRIKK
jgi:hypothetical protein